MTVATGVGSQTVTLTGDAISTDPNVGSYTGTGVSLAGLAVGNGANGGQASNYQLPASGTLSITPKTLTVSIIGNPTKLIDGNDTATLKPSNFYVTGFIGGQGAVITQAVGAYANAWPGPQQVSAGLTASDFDTLSGAELSNYSFPPIAYGPGTIIVETLAGAPWPSPWANELASLGGVRVFIPYPAPGFLSPEVTSLAQMPSTISVTQYSTSVISTDRSNMTTCSGIGVINSTEQILLQGDKDKCWSNQVFHMPISLQPSAFEQ